MKSIKEFIETLSKKLNTDKKMTAVILLGITGMLILAATELIPSEKADSKKTDYENQTVTVSCAEYEKDIEERLKNVISKIDGAGSVTVMVTLDSTVESVYAMEEKQQSGENGGYESEYVIVKTDDGEAGILLKTTQPQVRGVAVVCSGGNSAVVRRSITNTVTAVLGISAARVNITAMKTDNGG